MTTGEGTWVGFGVGVIAGATVVWVIYLAIKPTIPNIVAQSVADQIAKDPAIPAAFKPLVTSLAQSVAIEATQKALP